MSRDEIEALIVKIADGDRDAFGALYDRTSAKLFAVILRLLKDRETAEDVLQDAFLKVWKNAGRYSSNGLSPMTWLITIARNTAIDRLRTTKDTDDLADYADIIPSAGPTPEGSALAASEAKRIATCMEGLGADRRAAVHGAYLHGQTYSDLARQFDVPINTMRTWLRRSLLALRECLDS